MVRTIASKKMINRGCYRVYEKLVILLAIVVIFSCNYCDAKSSIPRSRRPSSRSLSLDNSEQKFKFDLNRKTSHKLVEDRRNPGGNTKTQSHFQDAENDNGRHIPRNSRQIKPSSCTVPGIDDQGTCMFVFDCNRAKGTHLGICRDGFYIGSCCKLPQTILPHEDDNLNEIEPTSRPSSSSPTTQSQTEVVTEEISGTMSTLTPVPEEGTNVTMTPTAGNRTELRDADFFSENGTVLIKDPKLICGRQFLPASRIVGGDDAYYGKWPWQISVRTWQNDARTFIHTCGAALLNENWAISAAHCFDRIMNQDLILRIGDFDLSDTDVPFNYTERRVQLVIPHPKFFGPAKTFEYDLALIRFYEPVVFQPNIVPICIPEKDEDFIGRTGVVTGWGRLYEGGPIPARLNEVQVPIMNNTECEEMFLKAGYIEKIPQIFLCAGWPDGGKDSCEGDSGGPLVLQTEPDNHWSLAGIISWGIGCSRVSHPGVYSRITEFRDWINLVSEF